VNEAIQQGKCAGPVRNNSSGGAVISFTRISNGAGLQNSIENYTFNGTKLYLVPGNILLGQTNNEVHSQFAIQRLTPQAAKSRARNERRFFLSECM